MRKKIVAGNWKMNKDLEDALEVADALRAQDDHKLHEEDGETHSVAAAYTKPVGGKIESQKKN